MEKELKIVLIVSRIVAPPIDGGSSYVFNTAKEISKRGHKLTFLSFKSDKHPQSPEMIQEFADIYYSDLEYKEYNFFSLIKSIFLWKPATIIERMPKEKMIDLMNKLDFEPDFFFLEGIHSAELTDYIKSKFPNTKTVLRQANTEYLLLKRNAKSAKNPFIKLALKIQQLIMLDYEKNALRKNDIITAVSESDIEEYKKLVPNKKYIPVIIFTKQKYRVKSNGNGNKILAYGDWNWHPNRTGLIWFLDKIYPQLVEYNFELNIIGRGFDEDYFRAYSKVNYLGFVYTLDKYLDESDFIIAPLTYGGGTKVKIIEALSNSMPVITNSFGNEGINAKDKEEILIADTEESFTNAIIQLLQDRELRIKLSKNAYNFASKRYNKDIIIDNFISELQLFEQKQQSPAAEK